MPPSPGSVGVSPPELSDPSSLLLTKLSAAWPYTLPYPWCVFWSLPVQQYGSAASQYDWTLSAEGQVKPAGRGSNYRGR